MTGQIQTRNFKI